MVWRRSMAMLCCLILMGVSITKADTLKLTSLLWPPYSGPLLVEQGASIAVVRAALKVMGHQLEVDFYPWSRTVKLASMPHSDYLGYFPEYYYETENFIFSKSIGVSPLGLVEQKAHPMNWNVIEDLNRYTLGVVKDYVNIQAFDSMVLSGVQPIEAVTSDEHNIKKVAAGRIDAAVMDVNVSHYLLKQKSLQPLADKLQINRHILANKQLYIAFRNTDEGRRWRDTFDQGLAQIDVEKVIEAALYNQH
ncbi:substrate-binding periplasmic protein [Shewanella morhuae]|uniref:substrate-binding periplasmic protein n=1 Tax=Shewanella morhuae TaxID=365591 RepID=UPI001BC63BE5|nr:transporter substrate-binding domain-containing protein [Shewanella morhuae]GIU10455.1 ABC transporter [Shewanella morhuae]